MFKKIFTVFIFALIFTLPQPTEGTSLKGKIPKITLPLPTTTTTTTAQDTLQSVEVYMQKLLANEEIEGKNILLVLDLDGTLTNKSSPSDDEAQPRENAVEFVKNMIDRGVKVVVSSAWHDFDATLKRIRDLGLEKKLNPDMKNKECMHHEDKLLSNTKLYVCVAGLVSSVRDARKESLEEEASFSKEAGLVYDKKIFSYQFVYQDLGSQGIIKHIVFADDSPQNVATFTNGFVQLQSSGLFENAQQQSFSLSRVFGQTNLE
ncbi:MAG: hypothetical protein ABFQ95_06820 [Pseudomonadota bacterium]